MGFDLSIAHLQIAAAVRDKEMIADILAECGDRERFAELVQEANLPEDQQEWVTAMVATF